MARPRIGISSYWTPTSWGPWQGVPATLVPGGYVEGVRLVGGAPLVVPADPGYVADPGEALDALDGLVLIGGGDIDPRLYGAEPHPATDPPNPRRDEVELALLEAALERDLPVLGICRGFQLLNVARGGDLVQHLGDDGDLRVHRADPGVFGRHHVRATGGVLAGLFPGGVEVHSHHHQGIGRVGERLAVTARSDDGGIEGLEDPDLSFCVGVLWHPEEDRDAAGLPLFRALVEAARVARARRDGSGARRERLP